MHLNNLVPHRHLVDLVVHPSNLVPLLLQQVDLVVPLNNLVLHRHSVDLVVHLSNLVPLLLHSVFLSYPNHAKHSLRHNQKRFPLAERFTIMIIINNSNNLTKYRRPRARKHLLHSRS